MAAALLLPAISGAQIKTLIMPGPVIEGHAELEPDCESCHQAFERGQQRKLCLDCHEDVALDIGSRNGFHGRSDEARDAPCASCHTDHEGRGADIVGLNQATFDHELTDFRLLGKHAEADCEGCHAPDKKYREAPDTCIGCHEADKPHEESLGTECAGCHNPSGWPDVDFDHDTTDYPLIGKHMDAGCLDCHATETFTLTSTTCYSCHAGDDAHDGLSGNECQNCHSPSGWNETSFDHSRDTEFPLTGGHAEQSCDACHSDDPFSDSLDKACVSCHLEDDEHAGHRGGGCDSCHSSEDWATSTFDHDVDTEYALDGAHASVECADCHVEPIFEVALESTCHACHEEDDPHDGTQGSECADCHNETAWTDDVFFDHGLTRFPLLGHHAETECSDCHETQVFRDAPTACVDCHADDDSHEGRFATDCALCHNPVDWLSWQFDHDTRTGFPLAGAHARTSCESCHRGSLTRQTALGERCSDCHRADDVHNGEFGYDCGRCHSADSFRDVRTLQ
jgi:hypothetical protein